MNKKLSATFLCTASFISGSVFAANGYIEDQNRAKELMSQCERQDAKRPGTKAFTDCLNGYNLWQATSQRLNKDIGEQVQSKEDQRRRIQQEEIWREQIRRR